MKIDLLHLKQEQDHTCVPACIRIVLHHLGAAFSETQICVACGTTPLGTDQNEATQGITLLGFKATELRGAAFDDITKLLRHGKPVIVFLSVLIYLTLVKLGHTLLSSTVLVKMRFRSLIRHAEKR